MRIPKTRRRRFLSPERKVMAQSNWERHQAREDELRLAGFTGESDLPSVDVGDGSKHILPTHQE